MNVTGVKMELQQNTKSGKSLQRNLQQILLMRSGNAALITHGLSDKSARSTCIQLSGIVMFYILHSLSLKVNLLQRNISRWRGVSTFVLKLYQGVILICAASKIDAQSDYSSSISNSNASHYSGLRTSSIYTTSASFELSPTPTQSTSLTLGSSLYPTKRASDMNAISSSPSINTLSSSVVMHGNTSMPINTPATAGLASSMITDMESTSPFTAVITNSISSYNSSRHFTTQHIDSSTMHIEQTVTAPVYFTSSIISTPALSSDNPKKIFVNITTSMIFSNAYTVNLQITDSTSTLLLVQQSSTYFNPSTATFYKSEITSSSNVISKESTSYISHPVTVQMNATTPISTVFLGKESTSYIIASSIMPNSTTVEEESTNYINSPATVQMNATTPTSTMLLRGESNTTTVKEQSMRHINASVTTYMNKTTPSPTISTYSTYVNATMTSSPTSSSILNGSKSTMTVLPSTTWPSSLTANNLSTPSVSMTVTSSVNQTQKPITPSPTITAINTSSLSLPTPSPDQEIRSFGVNVTIVNLEFTVDLNERNSNAYKNLELKAKNAFGVIFSSLPGFIRVIILKFSKGSVAVSMKAIFNDSTNVTTTKIKETIIENNATKNTQNFTFSQATFVIDECTPSFCMNGGICQTNATAGAFCTCRLGFTAVRCDKVIVNGSYSEWSSFSECSISCKGGKMHRKRTCTNPSPQHGGRDCSDLGPDYEEKDCNSDVLCPVIWIIIGVSCAVFLILLILLIICCLRRKREEKEKRSTVAGSQMNIVPLEIMVCDFDLPTARRKSPDGSSNPEFVGESETEEDDIYKKQLLLFLKQSHLIKPGMNLSFGDEISDTSDYSNPTSRKTSTIDNYGMDQRGKPKISSEL